MSSNFVGDYKFSAQTVDNGFWFNCDGRTLLISDYPELYAVIGTSFGYTNQYTFKLPKAQGRVVGIAGNPNTIYGTTHSIGHSTGDEEHQISLNEMPSHTHSYTAPGGADTYDVELANQSCGTSAGTTGSAGGSDPMTIMQPTLFIGNLFILWKTN